MAVSSVEVTRRGLPQPLAVGLLDSARGRPLRPLGSAVAPSRERNSGPRSDRELARGQDFDLANARRGFDVVQTLFVEV